MQTQAQDEQGNWVGVSEAIQGQRYRCPSCNGALSVRGRERVKKHFFHLNSLKKSARHQAVLEKMMQTIPSIKMEETFESIGRIADLVWHERRFIFEVQCSSICPEELFARNREYGSLGYQVIWILHEHQYNQKKLNEAERSLVFSPHYYTDIEEDGKGLIFDQLAVDLRGVRRKKGRKWEVDLMRPRMIERRFLKAPFWQMVEMRREHWGVAFAGDMTTRSKKELWDSYRELQ